jgi:serine/threonine protein kinase
METFAEVVARVTKATAPTELFGTDAPERVYRRLVRLLHPDTAPAGATATATAAVARLNALWAEHRRATGAAPTILTTRRHRYTVGTRIFRGDIADLHPAEYDGGRGAVLKIPRRPADNDLLEREAAALRTLARDGDPKYAAYVPRLIESFRHRDDATGAERVVNVIEHCAGFVSLAEVAAAYPDGVDPRDAAWMWRRLLVALGYAHRAGVVHGAVLPEHVLIHPDEHGVVLVDWCYSVNPASPGRHVPALIARHRDRYPPEVAAREPAGPGTDIYLATGCLVTLMGPRAPERLRRFARGCALSALRMRPSDAWRLLTELDEALHDLYGPRTFRPFALRDRGADS